ncbi:facilitated trehalose transporter Tret1-like [Epargyreus clarus]|uniref:facilitated trehalose transporter Tret1-like n=1 Tax=Epargyreus clarus TaxID=520877 RepID=UPI003C2CD16E
MEARSWISPFMKQCYVTTGLFLNMSSHGLVAGFAAILLPQLRSPNSTITVDESSESWIASVFGITFIVGNFITPIVMDKYGRKKTNIASIIVMAAGWYMTVWSPSVPWILACRVIQGFPLGLSVHVCPVMIGEYTSPKNRGAFLATVSLAISSGVLTVHTLGSYVTWRTTAGICGIIMTVDFFIAIFSPETPSWLISQGRYDESARVFRWLRGMNEEEELKQMVENHMLATSTENKKHVNFSRKLRSKLDYFRLTVIKEEFYKPILIVMHLYSLGQWGGSTILSQYTQDIFRYIVGDGVNTATMTVVLSTHRVISGIYMMYFAKKFKRRSLFITLTLVTVIFLLLNAGYSYARENNWLPFDYPIIGIILIHVHMSSICSGGLTLGFIVAGELFPLEYRSLAGGISSTFLSGNLFVVAKTAPHLFSNVGIHIAYCIYATISTYCLIVIWIFLPETKDRTLQDIEDGFRKKKISSEEIETAVPLTSR